LLFSDYVKQDKKSNCSCGWTTCFLVKTMAETLTGNVISLYMAWIIYSRLQAPYFAALNRLQVTRLVNAAHWICSCCHTRL